MWGKTPSKDFNVGGETLKPEEGKVQETFQDLSKDFVNRSQVTQEIMLTTDKWDLIKLKSSYRAKE